MTARAWLGAPLRGVRARLVTTYVLLALVVVAVGAGLFVLEIERGLAASTDADLDARSAALEAEVTAAGAPTDPGARTRLTLAEVYRPDGTPLSGRADAIDADTLTRARNGPVRFSRTVEGVRLRLLAEPVTRPDGTWVVLVGTDEGPADEATDRVEGEVVLGAPVLVLLAGLGAWVLSGSALRPVERMRAEAAELGAHDVDARISDPRTRDELAALATTFNELLDRLQGSAQRQRAFVADAGHELRTPLAVLRTELELADRPGRSRGELAEAVVHARSEVERLNALADDLLVLANLDEGQQVRCETVDAAAVLGASARSARARATTAGVTIRPVGDVPVLAWADPVALRRIVDNLLSNAIAATPRGGEVTLDAEPAPGGLVLTVSDTGSGFPADFLPHAAERFRRGDVSRTGTGSPGGSGLGLAIVDELVRAHGGELHIANLPTVGAVVSFVLPTDARRRVR